jgi:hypothetical protein
MIYNTVQNISEGNEMNCNKGMKSSHFPDRLCGVPGYRSRDPGSIPGASKFSEK